MTYRPKSRVLGAAAVMVAICTLGACSLEPDPGPMKDVDLAALSEFQRDILTDHEVTWAEYESAILAEHACLEDAGYTPNPIKTDGARLEFTTDVDYRSEADPAAADARFLEIIADCGRTYSRVVATVWEQGQVASSDGGRPFVAVKD